MSLENLLKARNPKRKGILVPRLNEFLLLEGKKPSGRKTGVFHPSEISGFFCPRQWVIQERHREELKKDDTLPGSMRTFEIGHRLHEMMQDFLAQMGLLYGKYKCVKCEEVYLGFKPENCSKCGKSRFDYQEVEIEDEEYHINGHTDGIVVIGNLTLNPKKYIFEFKTINSNGFRLLRAPLEQHKEQACIYMYVLNKTRKKTLRLMEEMGLQGTDQYKIESLPFEGAIIMYIDKGQQPADGEQDLKEYFVPFSEMESVIEPKIPLLEEAWEHYEKGTYPPRICDSRTTGHRCKCPKDILDYCFGSLKD